MSRIQSDRRTRLATLQPIHGIVANANRASLCVLIRRSNQPENSALRVEYCECKNRSLRTPGLRTVGGPQVVAQNPGVTKSYWRLLRSAFLLAKAAQPCIHLLASQRSDPSMTYHPAAVVARIRATPRIARLVGVVLGIDWEPRNRPRCDCPGETGVFLLAMFFSDRSSLLKRILD